MNVPFCARVSNGLSCYKLDAILRVQQDTRSPLKDNQNDFTNVKLSHVRKMLLKSHTMFSSVPFSYLFLNHSMVEAFIVDIHNPHTLLSQFATYLFLYITLQEITSVNHSELPSFHFVHVPVINVIVVINHRFVSLCFATNCSIGSHQPVALNLIFHFQLFKCIIVSLAPNFCKS